ncbi:NADH-ubiquinone oxidoreductase-F iron-sulfur binding region domain-containing protein [Actinocrinis sp.]|uniref:NADH-ubiquinone oxidoreductase-F iron-sulfur binding region domain-containing protein n=1 Tax=Actinocrinis sp. TaxID=1920516 RepID=UPI002D52A063|nr:NADH-ubiquinone oxidoreductase-F iron-sulfur binding region domain-containing protein [Actinocrinis sp.]HZP53409.1 NADH-ubiquinone oxidoreductase-F iron-sulfur binding region domain-containing protein [Actinocrinis sp.]
MTTQPSDTAVPQGANARRLLPLAGRTLTLEQHRALHGPPAYQGSAQAVINEVRAAGLTGRGGAGFPTYRKLEAVLNAPGRAVVVANGAEGEPASYKDRTLLYSDPHLVLDGLQLAAEAVQARQAYAYVHPDQRVLRQVREAVADRLRAGIDRVPVTVVEAPPRFIAGQETAVVHRIEGGLALPRYAPVRVTERGIGGAPTLVQNVETLAHLALIARYGAGWFRGAGTPEEPGSLLATVHRPNASPKVIETAAGVASRELLGLDGYPARAVLIGGYHGTWLPADRVADLPLTNAALRAHGASLGAGVLVALPVDSCGLRETARIVSYLAAESAGQCGPCLNGLPRIAHALTALAGPGAHPRERADVSRWAGQVERRGACHHPDGSMRLVRSALTVFEEELWRHEHGTCVAPNSGAFLPLPSPMNPPRTDEDWR